MKEESGCRDRRKRERESSVNFRMSSAQHASEPRDLRASKRRQRTPPPQTDTHTNTHSYTHTLTEIARALWKAEQC